MDTHEEKFQLWGTFSVMDHMREGAFLPEVILYDRLVIPIPPDPEKSEDKDAEAFALKQWKRWEDQGWDPDRQRHLLDILDPIAVPVEWNLQRHQDWTEAYEKGQRDAASQFAEILAGWKTAETLLNEIPAMAVGAVAISPYESLDALKKDLGITETASKADQLKASRGMPGALLNAIIGREFLVPETPEKDEFYLLKEAVAVVQQVDYREARANFHAAQKRFLNNGKTDLVSVTTAVDAIADHLEALDKITRRRRFWNGLRQAFFFTQLTTDLLTAPINPVAAGKAAIALGQFTANENLGSASDPGRVRAGGALLLDAHRKLNLKMVR